MKIEILLNFHTAFENNTQNLQIEALIIKISHATIKNKGTIPLTSTQN